MSIDTRSDVQLIHDANAAADFLLDSIPPPGDMSQHDVFVVVLLRQMAGRLAELASLQAELIGLQALRSEVEARLKIHRDNLADWENGYLAPTEPDADERRAVMERLKVAIHVLSDVLAFAE